jgi:hypothetical protein
VGPGHGGFDTGVIVVTEHAAGSLCIEDED